MAKQPTTNDCDRTPTRPVQVFRARGVKVAVFENRARQGGEDRIFHKLTLQRVYRDGEQWKTTTSLSRDDVPVARHLLHKAWAWILEAEAARTQEASKDAVE